MLTDDLQIKVIDFGNSEILSIFSEDEMKCNLANFKYFYTKIADHLKGTVPEIVNLFKNYEDKELNFELYAILTKEFIERFSQ